MSLQSQPRPLQTAPRTTTADVVKLLGAWWGELGSSTDDTHVFPDGHFEQAVARRETEKIEGVFGV